jgi:hypothetical protein
VAAWYRTVGDVKGEIRPRPRLLVVGWSKKSQLVEVDQILDALRRIDQVMHVQPCPLALAAGLPEAS